MQLNIPPCIFKKITYFSDEKIDFIEERGYSKEKEEDAK